MSKGNFVKIQYTNTILVAWMQKYWELYQINEICWYLSVVTLKEYRFWKVPQVGLQYSKGFVQWMSVFKYQVRVGIHFCLFWVYWDINHVWGKVKSLRLLWFVTICSSSRGLLCFAILSNLHLPLVHYLLTESMGEGVLWCCMVAEKASLG